MYAVIRDDPKRMLVLEWEGRRFKVAKTTSRAFFLMRDHLGLSTMGMLDRLMRSKRKQPWRSLDYLEGRMVRQRAIFDRWREEIFIYRRGDGRLMFVRRPLSFDSKTLWGAHLAPTWMEDLPVAKTLESGLVHALSGEPWLEILKRAA